RHQQAVSAEDPRARFPAPRSDGSSLPRLHAGGCLGDPRVARHRVRGDRPMKRILALGMIAALALAGAASAQRYDHGPGPGPGPGGPGPGQGNFAPERESDINSMSFLLSRGYQIVAGWEGTLVLQRDASVYLCPYVRYRPGNQPGPGQTVSQP